MDVNNSVGVAAEGGQQTEWGPLDEWFEETRLPKVFPGIIDDLNDLDEEWIEEELDPVIDIVKDAVLLAQRRIDRRPDKSELL